MKLKELGEVGLIQRLYEFQGEGLKAGIGEDCAVFPMGEWDLLVSTDLMVEGVHFLKDLTPPEALGYKVLAVNLSDLASCGALPLFYVVGLVSNPEEDWEYVERVYRGLYELSRLYNVGLAGGDLSRGERMMISLTIIGKAQKDSWIPRSGAKVGERLFVSGTLGGSALGLMELKKGFKESPFIKRHLYPPIRLELGHLLAKGKLASAMIDVSDGFLQDLERLIDASRVGAEIEVGALPLEEGFIKRCEEMGVDPLELALSGGEDYELLFTVEEEKREEVLKLGERLRIKLTEVGRTIPQGLRLLKDGRPLEIPRKMGYDHFRWGSPST
jgi:thiamine-monophosphate kinase